MQKSLAYGPPRGLSDPQLVWIGGAVILGLLFVASPPTAWVFVTATLAAKATQPFVAMISRTTGISRSLATNLAITVLLAILGGTLWFLVPKLVEGIKQLWPYVPKNGEHVDDLVVRVRQQLESVMPATVIDAVIKKLSSPGTGDTAYHISLAALSKTGTAIGHLLLGIVVYTLMMESWGRIATAAQRDFRRSFPSLADDAEWIDRRFEQNLGGIGRTVVIIIAMFAPIYSFMFWYIGGFPPDQAVVYGTVSAVIGGVPFIGGIAMHGVMWPWMFKILIWPHFAWDWHLMLRPEAIVLGKIIAALLVGHYIEAKFVSTKLVGKHLAVEAVAVLAILLIALYFFGLLKGFVIGFSAVCYVAAHYALIQHRHAEQDGEPATAA